MKSNFPIFGKPISNLPFINNLPYLRLKVANSTHIFLDREESLRI